MSSRNTRIAKRLESVGISGNNRFSRKAWESKNLLEVLKTVGPTGKLGFVEDCRNTPSAANSGASGNAGIARYCGNTGTTKNLVSKQECWDC